MIVERFIPVRLPDWERNLNRFFWISHSFLAFVIAYYTTNGEIYPWIEHWLHDSSYIPNQKIDNSDSEWWFYKKNFPRLFGCLLMNSIIFTFLMKTSRNLYIFPLLFSQLGLHVLLTSFPCLSTCIFLTIFVLSLVYFFRKEAIAWLLCIGFILKCSKIAPFSHTSYVYYLEFNLYAYTCLKIINVSIYLCRQEPKESDEQKKGLLVDILIYLLYLPFSITLIVLFDDFRKQLEKRRRKEKDFNRTEKSPKNRDLLIFAFRLLFWLGFLDFLMHFIYVNAVFSSPNTLLFGMNSYQVMSISYAVGQYFHIKYVVIFGIPSLFAKIDGMTPPPPPICVSRVSRYSRIWRHFDAGLYQFLKNQVYIPLMRNVTGWKGSVLRFISMVNVFLVVLVWHGFDSHYVYWVSLSGIELIFEWAGVALWSTRIFGVFCFLGSPGVGTTVFRKVLIDGSLELFSGHFIKNGFPSSGLIFFHMMVLGYFYNNHTLDYDEEKAIKTE
ncbi:unnamed protein product, partial [Mesorhabditis belari]|uniref:Protein-cysteine N-palmitoyltransferase Rasp n=1 Tax=Mesorhabditis belari TaxID=2138241 RepID=A0AAF3FBP9_9BILA